jgi:4-O-beta-D-mannosyl-D-glucose phosphorylase
MVDQLVDYVLHTPEDGLRTGTGVQDRMRMIKKNLEIIKAK